jgi:phosphatidylserine synthase
MLRYIAASNAVSYLALAAALAAIHFAARGSFHLTAAMWTLSALFDNFDGVFASLFKRDEMQKEFGKELDSFIDCIAFGIVPIACLRMLAYPRGAVLQVAFAVASLVYVVATVTRLGHFDMLARRGAKGFVGLPTTEAALVLATVLLFPFPLDYAWTILIVLSVLMLAPIRFASPAGVMRVLLTAWLVAVAGAHVWMHFARLR